jgi:hypothetical protein
MKSAWLALKTSSSYCIASGGSVRTSIHSEDSGDDKSEHDGDNLRSSYVTLVTMLLLLSSIQREQNSSP